MALVTLERGKNFTRRFDTATNRYRVEITIHDQHYRDGGTWQSVVEDYLDNVADGFDLDATRMRHRVRFILLTGVYRWHPIRGEPLKFVMVARPERKGIGQTWPVMLLGTRTRNGPSVSFDTADHGYQVAFNWHKVEHKYILKDATAPARVRWRYTFNNLTFDWATKEIRDGSTVVGHMGTTIAWDATGSALSPNVAVTETWTGTHLEVQVTVPTGVQWPIIVDPTLTLQPDAAAGIDGYIDNGGPNTNFGTDNAVDAIMTGSGAIRRGIAKFDVSSIPASSSVSSGILTITCRTTLPGTAVNVHGLVQSFTENGVTWNKYDGITNWAVAGGDYQAGVAGTNSGGFTSGTGYDFNITGLVQDWVDGSLTNNGLILKVGVEVGTAIGLGSYSSDSATASQRPKLVSEYTSVTTSTRTVNAMAALKSTLKRTILIAAALLQSLSRSVPLGVVLKATLSRAVSVASVLQSSLTRVVPVGAVLLNTLSRTVELGTVLFSRLTRTVPVGGVLKGTLSRTVSAAAVLTEVLIEIAIAIAAVLRGTYTRTVEMAAALRSTLARTVNCQAVLLKMTGTATGTLSMVASYTASATEVTGYTATSSIVKAVTTTLSEEVA